MAAVELFFTYRSSSFAYTDRGKGTAVVFLHGFLENKNMWRELVDFLPGHFRKICLDLPGHGQSDNIGYIHTMEEMGAVIKALLDHLKLKRIFLVAHSMGGYASLAFAEKYPEYVKGIILLNSTARADSEAKKKDRDRAINIVKQDYKSFIRTAIPLLFRPKNRLLFRKEIQTLKKEALQMTQQGVIAALEGMKVRIDREVLLHFAPYNFLLIAAEKDPALPFDTLKEQLKAEKVDSLITSNGHMAHIEDREIVFEKIRKFLVKNQTGPLTAKTVF